ncbi:MAG: hypothetical protein ACE5JS_23460, partial [Nitrospinota bacterium]
MRQFLATRRTKALPDGQTALPLVIVCHGNLLHFFLSTLAPAFLPEFLPGPMTLNGLELERAPLFEPFAAVVCDLKVLA